MTHTDVQPQIAPATEAPPRRASRRTALRIISITLLVVVLVFVGRDLKRDFVAHPWRELHCQPVFLVLAVAWLFLARLTNALNCHLLLAALGSRVPARKVIPVIWLASLGRYIPGKVAVVAGAGMMLVRLGVRLPAAAAALFLSTALMILMGMIASTPLTFMPAFREILPSAPILAGMILAVGLVCLYPPVFLRICNALLRAIKHEPLPPRMRTRPFWTAIALTACRSIFLGLGLWFAARSLVPLNFLATYPLALASAGLASVIGFMAVFAPAGLGVHEEVYRHTMYVAVGSPIGWLVAIFRILHIIADLLAAAVALVMVKLERNG